MTEVFQGLPVKEWEQLGQVMSHLHPMTQPDYQFKANHTMLVRIGEGCKPIKAGDRFYGPGQYYCEPEQ